MGFIIEPPMNKKIIKALISDIFDVIPYANQAQIDAVDNLERFLKKKKYLTWKQRRLLQVILRDLQRKKFNAGLRNSF